jgi:hypothetical protein
VTLTPYVRDCNKALRRKRTSSPRGCVSFVAAYALLVRSIGKRVSGDNLLLLFRRPPIRPITAFRQLLLGLGKPFRDWQPSDHRDTCLSSRFGRENSNLGRFETDFEILPSPTTTFSNRPPSITRCILIGAGKRPGR